MDVTNQMRNICEDYELLDLFMRFINLHWLAIVLTCLWVHVQELCVLGFCVTDEIVQFRPTLASTLFTLAVASLTAAYKLYPTCTLRPPHPLILLAYDVLTSLVISNTALLLIWIPISIISVNISHMIASQIEDVSEYYMGYAINSLLDNAACFLRQFGGCFIAFLFACGIYMWVLHATDSVLLLKDKYRSWKKCHRRPVPNCRF